MNVQFTKPALTAAMPECRRGCETGWRFDERDQRAHPCPCRDERIAANLFNHAGLPANLYPAAAGPLAEPKIEKFGLSTWRRARGLLERLIEVAVLREGGQYAEPGFGGISGVPGTGKSWLLANMVTQAALRQIGCAYVDVNDAFRALKTFGDGSVEVGSDLLTRVPLLAIDGIGDHRNTATSKLVRDLILARHREGMATAAATTLTIDLLTEEFGPVVADLFSGMVTLTHGSLRW